MKSCLLSLTASFMTWQPAQPVSFTLTPKRALHHKHAEVEATRTEWDVFFLSFLDACSCETMSSNAMYGVLQLQEGITVKSQTCTVVSSYSASADLLSCYRIYNRLCFMYVFISVHGSRIYCICCFWRHFPFAETKMFSIVSCHTSQPLMRHNYINSWGPFANNAIRWLLWAPLKDWGALLVEEERGATCYETPSASQPVFCGSSLQDTLPCQTEPRDIFTEWNIGLVREDKAFET